MAAPIRFTVAASGHLDRTELREFARKAEDLGYSTMTMADHLDAQLAPLLALSAAAEVTSTLRIGTQVLANDYRHPAILAKEVATLDVLSEGRLDLGIGAGWFLDDYRQAGIDFDRPGVRIERLREALIIVKALLRGETVSFNGEHYQIEALTNTPSCVQHPTPPVMVAGGGRKVLTLAAEEADIVGINPGLAAGVIDERAYATATAGATDAKVQWVADAAARAGRSPELHTRVHLAEITPDRTAVAESLAPLIGLSPSEALESPHALVGTVDECIEAVQSWRERWGITAIGIAGDAIEDMAPVVGALAPR